MSSLQSKIEKLFDDKLKKEFQRYFLLLQAYSDRDTWTYECDFAIDDEIYWDNKYKFYGNDGVEMTPVIEYFFQNILPRYITTSLIEDEIYEQNRYSDNEPTGHGWIYFTLYPKSQKFEIEISYDTYVSYDREYEDPLDEVMSRFKRSDLYKDELDEARKNQAIFIVGYEGGGDSGYVDEDCFYQDKETSNTKIDLPNPISELAYTMIRIYEAGYELDDGGRGEVEINFEDNTIILRHTEFSRMSNTIQLFELDI